MKNIIFNINNLKCAYKKSKRPVLEIDELEIEKGETTFFIGSSGVGKSTILESLGLMNQTIRKNKNSTLDYYYYNEKVKKDDKNVILNYGKKMKKNFLSLEKNILILFSNPIIYLIHWMPIKIL